MYIVINYIEDNFPVKSNRKINFDEKRLIKFLLYSGDEEDFMAQYGVDEVLVKGICKNYRCNNLNTALNLILIEKYLKGENRTFIKVIDVLK